MRGCHLRVAAAAAAKIMNRIRKSRASSRWQYGSTASPKSKTQGIGSSKKACLLTAMVIVVVLLSAYSIRLGRLHPHPDLEAATPEDLELVERQKRRGGQQQENETAGQPNAATGAGGAVGAGFSYFKLGQSGEQAAAAGQREYHIAVRNEHPTLLSTRSNHPVSSSIMVCHCKQGQLMHT